MTAVTMQTTRPDAAWEQYRDGLERLVAVQESRRDRIFGAYAAGARARGAAGDEHVDEAVIGRFVENGASLDAMIERAFFAGWDGEAR